MVTAGEATFGKDPKLNERIRKSISLALLWSFLLPYGLVADEGMWVYNNLPKKTLKDRYGFEPSDQWIDHMMKSSVRFPNGSGSFVSSNGLVMTNHHVAANALAKISTAE